MEESESYYLEYVQWNADEEDNENYNMEDNDSDMEVNSDLIDNCKDINERHK